MKWSELSTERLGVGVRHVDRNGQKVYEHTFDEVLSFHAPGFAPVTKNGVSWYIDATGNSVFSRRFRKAFGFYEGLASVLDDTGAFHIDEHGHDAYAARFCWCGNFQEKRCAVRNEDAMYYHIKSNGASAYPERYRYVGDFKYGVAVVQRTDGLSTHIFLDGQFVHGIWFQDAAPYHKGVAAVCDEKGWFHVDERGRSLYDRRFLSIEPFYNGQAHAVELDGRRIVIGNDGGVIVDLTR